MFASQRRVISVDFGGTSIKVAQVLLKGRKRPIIEGLYYEKFSSQEDLPRFLSSVREKLNMRKSFNVIALHGVQSIYRFVEVPKLDEVELEKAIHYEEEIYVPFPPEERVVDYDIIGSSGSNYWVALAGVKKSNVLDLVAPFTDKGFVFHRAELAGLALTNLFNFTFADEFKDKSVVILDVGAKYSIFVVLMHGLPVIIREISMGGDLFTEYIEDALQMSKNEAELLKLNPGDRYEEVITALDPIFYRFSEEIKVSMEYTGNISIGKIEDIFLIGGGSRCPGLKERLGKALKMQIRPWDCLSGFKIDKRLSPAIFDSKKDMLHVCLGATLL